MSCMSTCLYLAALVLWQWLEFETNQWTYHSEAALCDLCESSFRSAPMAWFRTIHSIKGWLFNSAHHLHWALLKPLALHTNVRLAHPTHTPADTFAVCLSWEHWRAFQLSNLQDSLDPVGRLGSLFSLSNSVGVLAKRCQSLDISDNLQGQFN